MKKRLSSALAATMVLGTIVPATFASASGFTDIDNSYAKDAILRLADQGVINGKDATHFDPQGAVTRAEFVKILVRSLNLPTSDKSPSFTDTTGHWASAYIEAAVEAGIVNGVGDGMFDPNGIVNREQAATMLVKALQTKMSLDSTGTGTFGDMNQVSDWAKPFIALAQKYNLVKGDGTNFNPFGNATREQAVILLENMIREIDNGTNLPSKEFKITPQTATMSVGQSQKFKVEGANTVTWSVSGNGTIDQDGNFTATSAGTATITALVNSEKSLSLNVTISAVSGGGGGNSGGGTTPSDTEKPVITLKGESTVVIKAGAPYTDAGVTAGDNRDGDLTNRVVRKITDETGNVYDSGINTSKTGTYTYHYNVRDAANNSATEITRTIYVVDATATEAKTPDAFINALNNEQVNTIILATNFEGTLDIKNKRDLTIVGQGENTVIKPTSVGQFKALAATQTHSPVVGVSDGANVKLKNLVIDGQGKGLEHPDFMGISFENASGELDNVTVKGIRDGDAITGSQRGIAIYAESDQETHSVTVKNSNVSDYQKGGMVFKGKALSVNVSGNTVKGIGSTKTIAQNGIQLSAGATGKISNNKVTGHHYIGDEDASSTGILIWQAGEGYVVEGNSVTDNDNNVYEDISSKLTPPVLKMGTEQSEKGLVTGVTVKANEILTVTSSKPDIVAVNEAQPFGLIAKKDGKSEITVTLTDKTDPLSVREGYVTVTVNPAVVTPPSDTTAPVIQNPALSIQDGLVLNFSVNEDLDLSKGADIQISYFTKGSDGKLTPIKNKLDSDNPLVKNKLWDGYLWGVETGKNYSKGYVKDARYEDVIAADTKLSTLVSKGYHSNHDMDYVNIDWTTPATYVVQVKVIDNAGNPSIVESLTLEVKAAPTQATFTTTNKTGFHGEKVYQEFQLIPDGATKPVDLSLTNISSISVTKPNKPTEELTIDTDPSLWFNVQNDAGTYTYNIVDKKGNTYHATLDWSGVNNTITEPQPYKEGDKYAGYKFLLESGDAVNLSVFDPKIDAIYETNFYEPKQLTPIDDGKHILWFNTGKPKGTYTYLIKHGNVWSEGVIVRDALAPALQATADNTDNDTDHDIVLTFTDKFGWSKLMTGIKVTNGNTETPLTHDQYSVQVVKNVNDDYIGTITIKAGILKAGTNQITIQSNGFKDAEVTQEMVAVNHAPTIKQDKMTQEVRVAPIVYDGSTPLYTTNVKQWFEDQDGDPLTYSVDPDVPVVGLVLDSTTGDLKLIPPSNEDRTEITIKVKASDGKLDTGFATLVIKIVLPTGA